jgi:hypothetical protein
MTITEAGWSPGGGALFGMDLLPVPLAVTVGQQVKAKVTLTLQLPPAVQAVGNVGVDGWDTSGTLVDESALFGNQIPYVDGNGGNGYDLNWAYEPMANTNVFRLPDGWTQSPMRTALAKFNTNPGFAFTLDPYVAGSCQRVRRLTVGLTDWNGPIVGWSFGNNSDNGPGVTLKFTAPQTKINTNTLKIAVVVSWGRVLVN